MVNCRLFGDESDLHFWTVASHYLQSFAQARQLSVSTAEGQAQSEATQPSPQNHLDICNDVLCESSYFQVSKAQEEKVLVAFPFFGKQRQTHDPSSQHLENSLWTHPETVTILKSDHAQTNTTHLSLVIQCQQHRPGHTLHSIINDIVYLLCCFTYPQSLREAIHTFKSLRSNASFTLPSLHLSASTFTHSDCSPHRDTLN